MAFSVQKDIKIPPSLKNIYKEIEHDLNIKMPEHGDLKSWATNGVLLLNTCLTVEKNKAGSHSNQGWETFTDGIISTLSQNETPKVFLLWGKWAENKTNLINQNKHLILTTTHPSPFSAHKGFLGCQHFTKCNAFLVDKGFAPIDWQIK